MTVKIQSLSCPPHIQGIRKNVGRVIKPRRLELACLGLKTSSLKRF